MPVVVVEALVVGELREALLGDLRFVVDYDVVRGRAGALCYLLGS